jgi:hypothetical protein|tara:strand:+ start:381 stop:608 length:228 start_codon:yes stop_codon:yes gene_type:complete
MKLNRKQLQKLILEQIGSFDPADGPEMRDLVLKVLKEGLPEGYTVIYNEGVGYEISGPDNPDEGIADMYLNFGTP